MNQPPVTFPMLQDGMPSSEGITLFAAGVAWLSIVGFPAVDQKFLADQAPLLEQQPDSSTP